MRAETEGTPRMNSRLCAHHQKLLACPSTLYHLPWILTSYTSLCFKLNTCFKTVISCLMTSLVAYSQDLLPFGKENVQVIMIKSNWGLSLVSGRSQHKQFSRLTMPVFMHRIFSALGLLGLSSTVREKWELGANPPPSLCDYCMSDRWRSPGSYKMGCRWGLLQLGKIRGKRSREPNLLPSHINIISQLLWERWTLSTLMPQGCI